jgi:hypothetical protein
MLDAYSRRARLAPAALAAAPALVLAVSALSALEEQGSIIAFVLTAAAIVICGLVRSLGRRLESDLWKGWGGPPLLNNFAGLGLRRRRQSSAATRCCLP